MEFTPLHFGNKLRVVNPSGRIGIVTLWSKVDYIVDRLVSMGVDLDSTTSKVAVIGNLYGNGLPQLLRNLLNNPQIRDLFVCGSDRSGSAAELMAFFEQGLEDVVHLGEPVKKIVGTGRIIDSMVTPEMFSERPRIMIMGDPTNGFAAGNMAGKLIAYDPPAIGSRERIEVPMPEVMVRYLPSEPAGHQIIETTPLRAWRALVRRIVRFGHLVHLKKGDRQELLNVRVVITAPAFEAQEELAKYGLTVESMEGYQAEVLTKVVLEDQPYSYGDRMRQHFGFDALDRFARRLAEDSDDRHCYHALWDSREDGMSSGAPCLVAIFFRYFDGGLTMTATFRTHNALDAWIKNIYGLMKIQEYVASGAGLPVGSLTVISHSISVDPAKYAEALRIAGSERTFEVRPDPCGQFRIEVDQAEGEIVVTHIGSNGEVLAEYRAKKAERLQHELAADCAISDIGHAIYVGRQLARAEQCLHTGEEYVQS